MRWNYGAQTRLSHKINGWKQTENKQRLQSYSDTRWKQEQELKPHTNKRYSINKCPALRLYLRWNCNLLYTETMPSQWAFTPRRSSSCVGADKTKAGKHPGAAGNLPHSGYDQQGLTTYGELENGLSGWLDWKLQVTEVPLLTTSLDLKVHRRVPVVPFCIITSESACMSIADEGFVTVNS